MKKQDPRMLGIGGAPTRVTTLPKDSAGRKTYPIASGFLDYFPDAIAAVSNCSYLANEQHHPGEPINWERSKSTDEADTMLRHFMQRGTTDDDGIRHSAKMAWRAMALLQKEIEAGQAPKVEVKDGPYCVHCHRLAAFRVGPPEETTAGPEFYCGPCAEELPMMMVARMTAMDKL
jgi:hypothetical protein